MNPRPLGYEPNELPDCSTPRHVGTRNVDPGTAHRLDEEPPILTRIGVLPIESAARKRSSARTRGRDVLDDEQPLARLDQTDLAAGEVFDGRRILAQAARLLPELGVFGAQFGQR